jgi:MFS family permease
VNPKSLAFSSIAVFSTSQATLFVIYPYLAERMGLQLPLVISAFSVGSFLFLVGGPFWSWVSIKKSPMFALKASIGGLLLSLLLLTIAVLFLGAGFPIWNGIFLGASRLIYGLMASGIVPVTQAILIEASPEKSRLKVLATQSLVLNAGRLLGPILSMLLVTHYPNLLLLIPLALCAGLIAWRSPELPKTDRQWQPPQRMLADGSWSLHGLALLATILMGILQSNLAAYLQQSLHIPSADASTLMAKLLIAGTLAMLLSQIILRQFFRDKGQLSLLLGALALVTGFTLLNLSPLALYPAICTMSIGFAWVTPSYTSLLSWRSERQAAVAGSLSAMHTIGYALGGLLTAATLGIHTRLPFYVAAFFSLIFTGLVLFILKGMMKKPTQEWRQHVQS